MSDRMEKSFRQKLMLFLILSLVGLGLNALSPEIFPGFNYLPGSITVFLAIRLLGPFWAFAVAFIVSSYVNILFGHPNAMIWLSLEGLLVGCVIRYTRFKNLFLVDLLYWPLVGNVILWVIFKQVLHVPTPGTIGAMLMFWLIGMNNALIAEIILNFTPLKRWLTADQKDSALSLQDFLFFSMTGLFWLFAFSVVIINGNSLIREGKREALESLVESGGMVQKYINSQQKLISDKDFFNRFFHGYKHHNSNFFVEVRDDQQNLILNNKDENINRSNVEFRVIDIGDGVRWISPVTKHKIPRWRVVQLSSYQKDYPLFDNHQLTVELPFVYFQSQVIRTTKNSLILLVCTNILMAIILRMISITLSRKIKRVSMLSKDLPQKIFHGKEIIWPSSSLLEVQQLTENFKETTDALEENFVELKQINEEMEQKVKARTHDLQTKNRALLQEVKFREESEEKFRILAEHTQDWDYWLSEIRQYIYISPSCEKITGYTAEQFMADPKLLYQIVSPDDQQKVIDHYENEDLEAPEHSMVFSLLARSGDRRWIEHHCVPVYDGEGRFRGRRGNNRDITERKEAEDERLKLEKEIRQKYKMEAVGILAGGMAHNFNNNLAIIMGNIELAQFKCTDPEEVKKHLDYSKTALLRSRDLIKQIMIYSRQEGQEMSAVKLAEVIEETLHLLRSTIPSTVQFLHSVSPSAEDVWTKADGSRIQEALINLCTNAVYAMKEKGDIKISLDPVSVEPADIPRQFNSTPGEYLRICVQDTGSGIARENLEKIFDPFFTTKPVGEGTGMGLSTIRGIVEQHNGFIKVHSVLTEGTTFELYFPVNREGQADVLIEEESLLTGSERILFVDDDLMVIEVGKTMLTEMGYQVTALTSSLAALEKIKKDPQIFDLVITDQTMPELTGKELALKIKEIRQDLPIILSTGYSSQVSAEDAKNYGICCFCKKPMTMTTLSQAIRNCLDNA